MTATLVDAPPVVAPRWRLGTRPGLDGIRAIAVLVVLLDHTPLWGFEGGGLGVDVFFVLSGFLITSLLLEELADTGRIRFGRFYARRALRLFPALLVMVAVVVVLMPLMPKGTGRGVVPALLYYTNWVRAFGPDVGVLGHTWSLGIEEQFYLLWPLLLLGLWKGDRSLRSALQLVLLVALAVAVRRQFAWEQPVRDPARIYNSFDFRADGLLIGCALAMALHKDRLWRWVCDVRTLGLAAVVVEVLFLGANVPQWDLSWWNRFAVGLAAAVVIANVCARTRGTAWLSTPALRWVGVRSYGLYLWHYPIFGAFRVDAGFDAASRPETVLAVLLSFLACALSYRFVEQPFLRIKHRLRSVPNAEDRPATRSRREAGRRTTAGARGAG